jgi:thiaminase/transcriptional activator TenA
MVGEPFSLRLRRAAASIWAAQLAHPFVRGIADGSLPIECFRHWVRQDYVFLIDYCRLFAIAAARAPDLTTMSRFAALLQATLGTEMELHRGYAAELGIPRDELERELAGPTTRGYVDFLLRTAALGDYVELAAALLPCMWGFAEIGQHLAEGPRPADARYAAWIDMYASAEFAELASWCRDLLDRLAEGASPTALASAEAAFLTSSRYELAFWEASYRLEQWPA